MPQSPEDPRAGQDSVVSPYIVECEQPGGLNAEQTEAKAFLFLTTVTKVIWTVKSCDGVSLLYRLRDLLGMMSMSV